MKAPKPLSPFNTDSYIRAYSNRQHNQSKFAPDVWLFFPLFHLFKGFQAVPMSCGTKQTLKLWVCHLSLAALLPDRMFPTTLLHNRALLLSIAPTLSCRSLPGGFRICSWKALTMPEKSFRDQKACKDADRVTREDKRRREGELLSHQPR